MHHTPSTLRIPHNALHTTQPLLTFFGGGPAWLLCAFGDLSSNKYQQMK
jgi:hypothetical protein